MSNIDLDKVKEIITDIEQEVSVIKTTLETITSKGDTFVPMIVFYKDSNTKQLVVVPSSDIKDTTNKLQSIAEALHLFAALPSSAAILALSSKVLCEDEMYEALNLFVISEPSAWMIQYPYSLQNNTITWHPQFNQCTEIDEVDMDDTGKDIATMLYYFTHTQHSLFTPPEILSYISSTGGVVSQINTKIEYFDFSTEEPIT